MGRHRGSVVSSPVTVSPASTGADGSRGESVSESFVSSAVWDDTRVLSDKGSTIRWPRYERGKTGWRGCRWVELGPRLVVSYKGSWYILQQIASGSISVVMSSEPDVQREGDAPISKSSVSIASSPGKRKSSI